MGDLFNGWPEDGEPMSDLLQELRWWYESDPDPRIKKAADKIERLQREVVTLRWGSEQYNRLADYVIPRKNLWADHDGSHTDSVIREIERLKEQVEYWQKRHDVLRDRYESQWGNGR